MSVSVRNQVKDCPKSTVFFLLVLLFVCFRFSLYKWGRQSFKLKLFYRLCVCLLYLFKCWVLMLVWWYCDCSWIALGVWFCVRLFRVLIMKFRVAVTFNVLFAWMCIDWHCFMMCDGRLARPVFVLLMQMSYDCIFWF